MSKPELQPIFTLRDGALFLGLVLVLLVVAYAVGVYTGYRMDHTTAHVETTSKEAGKP